MWIKFCTHLLLYRIHLWANLDRDQLVGGSSQTKTTVFFCNTCNVPWSCMETTDRRDFGGKPSEWRWGRVLSWKIPEFCSVGRARSKNSIFFAFLGNPSTILCTAYRKFYPKPMVLMESWDSEGVPFASLESLWPAIWQKGAEKWSRDHHKNWKFAYGHT